ncbi:MAG: ROK family protein [Aestuariivirga sp.]|nr:ROK family protein [Aestuariivirga sp.]
MEGTPLTRGTTQRGARLYNERLILSLVRLHGQLPKAEMARLTGLSAQTVSVIVRQLEADGLLRRRTPQRGKVGQPLVPFELDSNGAFSIGLKVGRRSGDLMLLDLAGRVRHTIHRPYTFPSPAELMGFVKSGVEELVSGLDREQRGRISGMGIAAPFELWNWAEDVGAPSDVLMAWKGLDLQAEIAKLFSWPIHFCNDASAACAAELLFGRGRDLQDFAYFYLGYFIGGGVVLNGSLYLGRHGNAGALASFPITSERGQSAQLVHSTSLAALERDIHRDGGDPELLWRDLGDWKGAGPALDRWLTRAALDVAAAAVGVMAVLDCSAIVIDGAVPLRVRTRFVDEVQKALTRVDHKGLAEFPVLQGTVGADARALGAASLPLFDNFIINRNVLFKEKA